MSDNDLRGMRWAFGEYREGVNYKTVDYAINEIDSLRQQLQSAKAEIDELKKVEVVIWGDEVFAGIFEDEVDKRKNCILLRFEDFHAMGNYIKSLTKDKA